ncbi:MAG: tetratricopeptide repeat protein [Candidatus Omnitrophota bacterium]|nr:MAG: tetratricopeptide repeat protein [Candidatus Omnitrophota bacterium]
MKKGAIFTIILSCLIFFHRSVLGENNVDDEIRKLLGEAYIMAEDYESAEAEYRKALKEDPKNIAARIGLADILSWQKKYADAIALYDEVLGEEENVKIRLQKARILGWARKYDKSLKEYRKILDMEYDKLVKLEMNAKTAYWANRVEEAIFYYKELIEKDPGNLEARFDLSQIYSYQSMWKEAEAEYKHILHVAPTHFRAEDALQKTGLISRHICSETGYGFFEADSSGRHNDIRWHAFREEVGFPVNDKLRIITNYNFLVRNFSDFNDIIENNAGIRLMYNQNPDGWLDGFYSIYAYDKDIKAMHNFGSSLNIRVFDTGISRFSYRRERLENNSAVIREHYYNDIFKERVDIDAGKRLKLGGDFQFSCYSDGNWRMEPAFDLLYYLSLEPMRFSVKYGYFYREFKDKVSDYFSPKGFSTNKISLNWRHFLNKEEVFFGADNLYYDLRYDITIDSEEIVGHKFSGEFNWDINKKLNFNMQGSITNTSNDIYNDKSLAVSLKYYF